MSAAPQWEAAYRRFESPAAERRKFLGRLRAFGVDAWPREQRVLEACCGAGSGLTAWRELGFSQVHGVDLSLALLQLVPEPRAVTNANVCQLPFATDSFDIVTVQGGLHHLPQRDWAAALDELARVLRPEGQLLVVEPWRTPFLLAVHWLTEWPPLRRLVPKFDAFATMTALEADTYFPWLDAAPLILSLLEQRFEPQQREIGWGKLKLRARPR